MKKHHKKSMKEGSIAEEAMESPAEEAAEQGAGGMKKGGKVKKGVKAEGMKAKARLDKPMKRATGGSVDATDAGVSPSSPFAQGSPMRSKK